MAQLHCHCSTAHRLGAKPAPVPGLFPNDGAYLSIMDEEGRLWFWQVDEEILAEFEDLHTKTPG
jgi:hypothetical protein